MADPEYRNVPAWTVPFYLPGILRRRREAREQEELTEGATADFLASERAVEAARLGRDVNPFIPQGRVGEQLGGMLNDPETRERFLAMRPAQRALMILQDDQYMAVQPMLKQYGGDPFSLRPGERRFAGSGEEVAAAPPLPDKPQLVGPQSALVQGGQEIYANPRQRAVAGADPNAGFFVTLPDGTMVGTGAQGAKQAWNARSSAAFDRLQAAQSTDADIGSLAEILEADTSKGGVAGTVRRRLSSGVEFISEAFGKDAAEATQGFINRQLEDASRSNLEPSAQSAVQRLLISPEERGKMNALEFALGYTLARTLRGSGRLALQEIEEARSNISPQGRLSGVEVARTLRQIQVRARRDAVEAQRSLQVEGVLVIPGAAGQAAPPPEEEGVMDFEYNALTGESERRP